MNLTKNSDILEKIDDKVLKHVQAALEEDLPQGDLTTQLLNINSVEGHGKFIAKQDLILSGSNFLNAAFLLVDHTSDLNWHFGDGEEVLKGQCFLEIEGNLANFLKSERTALNYIGRMSGIASLTHQFVQEVKHTKCKILDTRKTTPLYREFEKKAVLDGGGENHRMNLSDAVMLKENHILAAGGIQKAVDSIRKRFHGPVEVETTNLEEVKQAVEAKIQRIMLDNMSNETMAEALTLIPAGIETEASGNMTLDRVKAVAEVGVDFISIGALTHSAPCADISLVFDWKN
ncbi:MAG: nicotinate-nucleotide diphosphorylase (carboxylating) [Bdellovibrionaceae bacterium]|nr:nicotinate-nucleotide diphosphorylase (carboxylating) [Pseudobdellovibrionaceae bacterium]|tara:strand:- start:29259 stop:30125 length:867 start_codon:yes stop_codon:yes gene_type:complete